MQPKYKYLHVGAREIFEVNSLSSYLKSFGNVGADHQISNFTETFSSV
jgi:hypothetical protein